MTVAVENNWHNMLTHFYTSVNFSDTPDISSFPANTLSLKDIYLTAGHAKENLIVR